VVSMTQHLAVGTHMTFPIGCPTAFTIADYVPNGQLLMNEVTIARPPGMHKLPSVGD
jgi:hypothetical protein